jgi:hypothetical protein
MTKQTLGALTTLNLSTHVDPMFTDLYSLRELISDPSYTAATPRMTIDASGNFAHGTAAPKVPYSTAALLSFAVEKATTYAGYSAYAYTATVTAGGVIVLGRSKSAVLGTLSATAAEDGLGAVLFEGVNSSSALVAAAYQFVKQDGAAGASFIPGRIEWYTSDGTAAPAFNMRLDKSGNLAMVGATATIGYGTGAGGAVTQATSKSTGVTLNKSTGVITMNNAALGAGVSVAFTLSNSQLAVSDVLVCNASSTSNYRVEVGNVGSGAANIRVTNTTAGSLSDALTINFAIIKGVAA